MGFKRVLYVKMSIIFNRLFVIIFFYLRYMSILLFRELFVGEFVFVLFNLVFSV